MSNPVGTVLRIILDGDGAFKEFDGRIEEAEFTHVTALEGGMASGNPSVAVLVQTRDGRAFFAETSLRLFLTAADVFKAKYGDPREEPKGGPS
jgi:hypothetical protein